MILQIAEELELHGNVRWVEYSYNLFCYLDWKRRSYSPVPCGIQEVCFSTGSLWV